MNKVLVDTNVLVYSVDEDSQFHLKSQYLISSTDFNLYTTSKNLSEFLVVLTRGIEITVTVEEALESLEDLMSYLTILYPSKDSFSRFKELLSKYKPKGLKIHDFEIISIGLENGVSKVATINVEDFKGVKEIELIEF